LGWRSGRAFAKNRRSGQSQQEQYNYCFFHCVPPIVSNERNGTALPGGRLRQTRNERVR
jgi:hypothetical protein